VYGKGFPTQKKHLAVHPILFSAARTALSTAHAAKTAIKESRCYQRRTRTVSSGPSTANPLRPPQQHHMINDFLQKSHTHRRL
jgi:hypothetical protein